MSSFRAFTCRSCGEIHRDLPAWHFDSPIQVQAIPHAERASRVELTADQCVIDRRHFYVKGLLEVPVRNSAQPFVWGVWLSISDEAYRRFAELFADPMRTADTSFFGWLCNSLPEYPETQLLKTRLHIREFPMRPWIELERTEHPLAIDQRDGLTEERAIAMAERLLHSDCAN